jgi:hypothetical protein
MMWAGIAVLIAALIVIRDKANERGWQEVMRIWRNED